MSNPVKCPSCSDVFDDRAAMRSHHVQVHDESLRYESVECEYCGDDFRAPERRERRFCSVTCSVQGRHTDPDADTTRVKISKSDCARIRNLSTEGLGERDREIGPSRISETIGCSVDTVRKHRDERCRHDIPQCSFCGEWTADLPSHLPCEPAEATVPETPPGDGPDLRGRGD